MMHVITQPPHRRTGNTLSSQNDQTIKITLNIPRNFMIELCYELDADDDFEG